MKMILSLIFMIPCLALADLAEPQVVNNSQAHEVILGEDAQKALTAFDKNLKILEPRHYMGPIIGLFASYPNELPQAVSDDFNGDGVKDIIVMGMSEEKKSIVIKAVLLVSSGKKFVAIPLDQWNAGLPRGTSLKNASERVQNLEMYLGLVEKQEAENTSIPRDRRGFKIEVYEKDTTLYYFKDGAIHKPLRRYSN